MVWFGVRGPWCTLYPECIFNSFPLNYLCILMNFNKFPKNGRFKFYEEFREKKTLFSFFFFESIINIFPSYSKLLLLRFRNLVHVLENHVTMGIIRYTRQQKMPAPKPWKYFSRYEFTFDYQSRFLLSIQMFEVWDQFLHIARHANLDKIRSN